MALPSKIKTATLSFGSAVNIEGTSRRIDVEITPRFNGVEGDIVWAETQTIIHLGPIAGEGVPGDTVNLVVPIDQPGFLSAEGFQIPVGSIAYMCRVKVNGQRSYEKLVHPARENELIDVDGIVSAKDVIQQLGSIPIVRSVNGMTGDVTITGTGGGAGTGDGAPGASAYQIWLGQGGVGTEADFLRSIQGKPGTNGADGANGTNGAAGKDGAPGPITAIKTLGSSNTYVTPATAPSIYLSTTADAPQPPTKAGDLWLRLVV